jgi:hypothetical protein
VPPSAPANPLAPPGRNGFAIASIFLAVCGVPVLGLVFGIIALVQTKRTGQRGRGLAVAGVTLSALTLVAAAAVIAWAIISGAQRDASGQVSEAGSIAVTDLATGDCVESVTEGEVDELQAVPCAQPHHAEVFAVFTIPGGSSYPGESAVETLADRGCESRLEAYSASAAADDTLTLYYLAPTRQSWALRDRSVVCLVSDDLQLRTGSVKD